MAETAPPWPNTKDGYDLGEVIAETAQAVTVDLRPCLENYVNNERPSLEELHSPYTPQAPNPKQEKPETTVAETPQLVRLGWIQGVYVRSLLNIWGVMLFLRMGWMVGQAGMGFSILIVLLSSVITVITTLSMSAICTNGKIEGGGAYYLVSRSLGSQIGGAVGAMFSFAICIAASMYVVGAAEALHDILRDYNIIFFDKGLNDIRLFGGLILLALFLVVFVGLEFESKAQIVLLALLLTALANYFIGTFVPANPMQQAQGFVGWSWTLGLANLRPDYRNGEGFFTVFSIFFPSVIGILAGANISGDLKDPSLAIPRGTLWAIFTSSFSYLAIILFLGFTLVRDASGLVEELESGLYLDCLNRNCTYGLMNHHQMMSVSALFGPFLYAGIFAATLSSALAALISAPRLLQALAKDKIFPYLGWLSKGCGARESPHIATLFCFLLCFLFVLIGDLNAIAPIISNFFMATYGMINFACFFASFVRSPGFRPSFRFYNQWLSLLGAVFCIAAMFVMNWVMALITVGVATGLYIYISKNRPDINWGTSTQAVYFKTTLQHALQMNRVEDHVKNYRPCILVLSGNPCTRAPMVDLANEMARGDTGLIVCGHVLHRTEQLTFAVRKALTEANTKWLDRRKIKAFYVNIEAQSLSQGSYSLMQTAGLGKMRPNIVMLGFPSEWSRDLEAAEEYVNILHHALDLHLGLMVLRLKSGPGLSRLVETQDQLPVAALLDPDLHVGALEDKGLLERSPLPDWVVLSLNQFRQTQQQGNIDIWWLYDDGGLTILMPYLLSLRQAWKSCQLRVLVPIPTQDQSCHRNMISLLKCLRIGISEIQPVLESSEPPREKTQQAFEELVQQIGELTPQVLANHADKTLRHMKFREMLREHSSSAALIIATLPLPRKESCPPLLYLAWLDLLTQDLPPCLLIRGNQESVLTFLA